MNLFFKLNVRLINIFNNYFTHYFVTVSVDIYRVNGEEKTHFAGKQKPETAPEHVKQINP